VTAASRGSHTHTRWCRRQASRPCADTGAPNNGMCRYWKGAAEILAGVSVTVTACDDIWALGDEDTHFLVCSLASVFRTRIPIRIRSRLVLTPCLSILSQLTLNTTHSPPHFLPVGGLGACPMSLTLLVGLLQLFTAAASGYIHSRTQRVLLMYTVHCYDYRPRTPLPQVKPTPPPTGTGEAEIQPTTHPISG